MTYVSPYGQIPGLPGRLADWLHRLRTDRTLPWVGLGLIHDLEALMQLLDLQEFAEWLRTKGDPAHAQFADAILRDQFTLEAVREAVDIAGYRTVSDPVKAIETLDQECRGHEALADQMRQVLIDTGALAPDDTVTPLPDLLRALLL